jgi:hypothetical protein
LFWFYGYLVSVKYREDIVAGSSFDRRVARQTVPLSIIRSFSLYTQQWYMSYRFAVLELQFHPDPARKQSAKLYDIYHCCVYSEKLLMIDRGTVRKMQIFIPRVN